MSINLLFIGDIFGICAAEMLNEQLPQIRRDLDIQFCIANGENSAGGKGITPKEADLLFSAGVDVITLGNHYNSKKEYIYIFDDNKNIIMPANYSDCMRGSILLDMGRYTIGVINLSGKVFINRASCPFEAAERELQKLIPEADIIVIDVHAEATSEKKALAWYLDGRVTAVIGTHTHTQTADEMILPQGTAFITDVGMTGPRHSVLGMDPQTAVNRLLGKDQDSFIEAQGELMLQGVLITLDECSYKPMCIKRINYYGRNA